MQHNIGAQYIYRERDCYCNFSVVSFVSFSVLLSVFILISSIVFKCLDNSPITSVILISGFVKTLDKTSSA